MVVEWTRTRCRLTDWLHISCTLQVASRSKFWHENQHQTRAAMATLEGPWLQVLSSTLGQLLTVMWLLHLLHMLGRGKGWSAALCCYSTLLCEVRIRDAPWHRSS